MCPQPTAPEACAAAMTHGVAQRQALRSWSGNFSTKQPFPMLPALNRIHPARVVPQRRRRSNASRLQSPPPCAAMYRKMKQSSTAGSPWFWMGQKPLGWWN